MSTVQELEMLTDEFIPERLPESFRKLQALLDVLWIATESPTVDDASMGGMCRDLMTVVGDLSSSALQETQGLQRQVAEQRNALELALLVVARCNADGAFDDTEFAIRTALDLAERGAA